MIDCAPGRIFDLYVLLSPIEDFSYPGDFMLHQVFIGVGDLQPTDERSSNHIVIAVIHQGYFALELTCIIFEALSRLHLDRESRTSLGGAFETRWEHTNSIGGHLESGLRSFLGTAEMLMG